MILVANILFNLAVAVVIVFLFALFMMMVLNPSASISEIFAYWKKNYESNRQKGRLF